MNTLGIDRIVFGGMSGAESASAMVADAFHQIASLDRLRAAYAAPRWDWVQHAFASCLITQLFAALDDGRYLNIGFRPKMRRRQRQSRDYEQRLRR
jgi:hypothetical protein